MLQNLTRWLRSCAVCESMGRPIDLICPKCWSKLEVQFCDSRNLKQFYLFDVYSLLRWNPHSAFLTKPLVYALKGGAFPEIIHSLAERFCQARIQTRTPYPVRPIIVPAPPGNIRQADHADRWAQALAELTQGTVFRGLTRTPQARTQKRLNRNERQEVSFLLTEPLPPCISDTTVIFADDLITTGATAVAAFKALGRPPHYEVWTLVCREQLATPIHL